MTASALVPRLPALALLVLVAVPAMAEASHGAPLPAGWTEEGLRLGGVELARAPVQARWEDEEALPGDEVGLPGHPTRGTLDAEELRAHDEGQLPRILVGTPVSLFAGAATAFVGGNVLVLLAFGGASPVVLTAMALLLGVGVGAAGAGTMYGIGSAFDGRGSFRTPFGYGLTTMAVTSLAGAILGAAGSDEAAFLVALAGIPLSAAAWVVGYEVSSEEAVARHRKERALSAVPVIAPLREGGAVAGLAVAF